jgi:hypothetical protein
MDFTEIIEKYPNASTKCICWQVMNQHNDNDLLDFFDENGIYINITSDCPHDNNVFWAYQIKQNGILHTTPHCLTSRQKAKTESYPKAFEILEQQL